jgi:hypothetical protein
MPDPKKLKFRDFYLNRFGQFLSEIGTMPSPNPIFIQISDKGVPGLECRTVGWLVSPAEGRQIFFWNPPVTGPQKANLRYLD